MIHPPKEPSTLLPTPVTESEKTANKRKILVIVFTVILIVAVLTGLVDQYRSRFDDFTKFRTKVESAIVRRNLPEMVALMSANFAIQQPETGGSLQANLKTLAPKVLELGSLQKWSNHFEDFENTRILYPEKGTLQLVFTRTPSGWEWTGVQSVSPDELAYLSSETQPAPGSEGAVEYKEIQTDEAKGDEPSL